MPHEFYFFKYLIVVAPIVPLKANGAWSKQSSETGESKSVPMSNVALEVK